MNNSTRITRLGATVLLAIGLMSVVLAAGAQPLSPDHPDGVIVHGACPDTYDATAAHDDAPADASTLTAGGPQSHNFDGNTNLGLADKDWARFSVVRTGVYTLTTSNLSAPADTALALHDANGALVMENDNTGGPASQIVWSAPETASGWYYVSVYPTGTTPYADCAGTVVSYTLSMASKEPVFILLPVVTRNYP